MNLLVFWGGCFGIPVIAVGMGIKNYDAKVG